MMSDSLAPVSEAERLALVDVLYRAVFRRTADEHGRRSYAEMLGKGASAPDVVNQMIRSDEFRGRLLLDRTRPQDLQLSAFRTHQQAADATAGSAVSRWPEFHPAAGESGRGYARRRASGFFDAYCSGDLVLDVGFAGYEDGLEPFIPGAIGIDLGYPGYDGLTLPFEEGTVDCVHSSHAIEHIPYPQTVIQDWFRVCKVGGFIVCMAPHHYLYEKKRFPPSPFNGDHRRFYTPAKLMAEFEEALAPNSYRLRHLADNDQGFDYSIGPGRHSTGAYEIELVIEKITPPSWTLK